MNTRDLVWTAGFLEGEGSFAYSGAARMLVSNTDREPLERLHRLFGGSLTLVPLSVKSPRGNESPCYRWQLSGSQAAGLMMTMLAMGEMTQKRHRQIEAVLTKWRASPPHPMYRTACRQGHPYTPENTYMFNGGKHRACRICVQRKNSVNYYAHKAAAG